MSGYHRFVFDQSQRVFVGQFEAMYRAESQEQFDSWHQEDTRNLTRRVCLAVLDEFNFNRVLDIGCGKGAFTHRLKKSNNTVIGVDLSDTALATARARYPDVDFRRIDVATEPLPADGSQPFDLTICLEALSYIEDWRTLLQNIARHSTRAMVALYLPDNPIGFVKSLDELLVEFSRHFRIDEEIRLSSRRQLIVFGTSTMTLSGEA